jgi:integrase
MVGGKKMCKKKSQGATWALTAEEVRRMFEAAGSQRNRAIMSVLYESGAMSGELLPLRLKDVKLGKYGAVRREASRGTDSRCQKRNRGESWQFFDERGD